MSRYAITCYYDTAQWGEEGRTADDIASDLRGQGFTAVDVTDEDAS